MEHFDFDAFNDFFDLFKVDEDDSAPLPQKLQEDIRSLLQIAHSKGSLQSATIKHWLNEKRMLGEYPKVVDYLQS